MPTVRNRVILETIWPPRTDARAKPNPHGLPRLYRYRNSIPIRSSKYLQREPASWTNQTAVYEVKSGSVSTTGSMLRIAGSASLCDSGQPLAVSAARIRSYRLGRMIP